MSITEADVEAWARANPEAAQNLALRLMQEKEFLGTLPQAGPGVIRDNVLGETDPTFPEWLAILEPAVAVLRDVKPSWWPASAPRPATLCDAILTFAKHGRVHYEGPMFRTRVIAALDAWALAHPKALGSLLWAVHDVCSPEPHYEDA